MNVYTFITRACRDDSFRRNLDRVFIQVRGDTKHYRTLSIAQDRITFQDPSGRSMTRQISRGSDLRVISIKYNSGNIVNGGIVLVVSRDSP